MFYSQDPRPYLPRPWRTDDIFKGATMEINQTLHRRGFVSGALGAAVAASAVAGFNLTAAQDDATPMVSSDGTPAANARL